MPAHAEPRHSRQGRRSKALGEGTRGKQAPEHAQRYEDSAVAIGGLAGRIGPQGLRRWAEEAALSLLTTTGNSAKLCGRDGQ